MINITFFTSNTTKLAHARHLADGLPLRIDGFKQRTYHAGYQEPRTQSRAELLDASYRSALEQGRKAGIVSGRHFFILEDTSVRLEALSDDSNAVPGLDIKFWMKDRTFDSVNELIASGGGDRRATVRSDVLLHIPSFYKERWGLADDYVVFVGEQTGTVTLSERLFETNPVFPWLDNRSFNKWFVPDGATEPLGILDVKQADAFDFRRKSFQELFEFLRSKNLLEAPRRQEEMMLDDRPVTIVCGYSCAGKTTASQHLAQNYANMHVEASDFMYLNYYIRHDVQGEVSISDFAERALADKPEIAAEKIGDYMRSEGFPPTVISGFRSPDEVEWMNNWLRQIGGKASTVFIEAPEALRYDRMRKRQRKGDLADISSLRRRDEQQRRMGLDQIATISDAITLTNSGTLEDYLDAIDGVARQPRNIGPSNSELLQSITETPTMKLEDAILISLLTKWDPHENREYFTTSEIAKVIVKSTGKNKHKDNVSRYFNQNFYPYYDISVEEGHRRYRLSNTGYDKASRILRRMCAELAAPKPT